MIKYAISKDDPNLKGEITLSPSKPMNHKFLVIRILKSSNLTQRLTTESEDSRIVNSEVINEGIKKNRGTSAKALRHIRAFLNYFGGEWILSSSNILKDRSTERIVKVLQKSGLNVSYEERSGMPPFRLIGKNLSGIIQRVDGSINSKIIEGKLLFAPTVSKDQIEEICSSILNSNYVGTTLRALQYLGVNTDWKEDEVLVEHEVNDGSEMVIEPDWSLASCWYQMVALAQKGELLINGLKIDTFQNESAVRHVYKVFGISTLIMPDGISIKRKGKLTNRFTHDFTGYPNLLPSAITTCVGLGIPFEVKGIESVNAADPNRMQFLVEELAKVGAKVELKNIDGAEVATFNGSSSINRLKSVELESKNDYRVLLALAAIAVKGIRVTIDSPLVTNKAYPSFWDDMKKLGFVVKSVTGE